MNHQSLSMLHRLYLAALICVATGNYSLAQQSSFDENVTYKQLQSYGVDTILSFQQHTIGGFHLGKVDTMMCSGPYYLLWKSNGKTWFKKELVCFPMDDEGMYHGFQ